MTQPAINVATEKSSSAGSIGKPNSQAWYRPTLSHEHGVYVVLLVSFLTGAALAVPQGIASSSESKSIIRKRRKSYRERVLYSAYQRLSVKVAFMTQELIDLRTSILEGRYADALAIVDELEGMSKQAILRNIESFLVRMLVHLIKNQIEQRLTNSWVASISDSLRQIQKLNLKENKTSYYIKQDEWEPFLEEAIEAAIRPASVEVMDGVYNSFQLSELVNRTEIIMTAQRLLDLTYEHSAKTLPAIIDENLVELPGGEEWKEGRR